MPAPHARAETALVSDAQAEHLTWTIAIGSREPPLRGWVQDESGRRKEFTGLLELVTLLETSLESGCHPTDR